MNFNGRKANNIFSHIDNLNTLPSDYDLAMPSQQNAFDLEADMAMFTNTQFFDFDLGESKNANSFGTTFQQPPTPSTLDSSLSFMTNDFRLPDFSAFPTLSTDASFTPSNQPAPLRPETAQQTSNSPPTPSGTSASAPAQTGESLGKRKAETEASTIADDDEELDEPARFAAEEDKRRRNTAASARFRVKKKQREQAMEKTAKEMTDRVTSLESRVVQLEMENKILKDLIVAKEGMSDDVVEINKLLAQATKKLAAEAKAEQVKFEKPEVTTGTSVEL